MDCDSTSLSVVVRRAHPWLLRLSAALVVITAMVSLCADRAMAHGGGSDATNYLVVVDDVGLDGLQWEVYAGDAQIGLTNGTGSTVTIAGYNGEPYLQFVPGDGVFENRRSPAVYLNADRYGTAPVPVEARENSGGAPEWVRVASGSSYWWHDHRTHWMSPDRPAAVEKDPGIEQQVLAWEIPIAVEATGGTAARGRLMWVPPVPAWPPVVLPGVALGGLVLAVAGLTRRPIWAVRVAACLVGVVAASSVAIAIDDAAATRASPGEDVAVILIAVAAGSFVLALCIAAWRLTPIRVLAAAAAGLATMLLFAAERTSELSASQITTTLPTEVRRWVVGASAAVIVPSFLATALGARAVARLSRERTGRVGSVT